MPNSDLLKPGQKSPGSGQVEIVGPRGGKTGEGERTVVKTNRCLQHQKRVKNINL